MRQLLAFLDAIRIRNTKKFHNEMSVHAKFHHFELQPLADVVSSNEGPVFNPELDKIAEQRAKRIVEERKFLERV